MKDQEDKYYTYVVVPTMPLAPFRHAAFRVEHPRNFGKFMGWVTNLEDFTKEMQALGLTLLNVFDTKVNPGAVVTFI